MLLCPCCERGATLDCGVLVCDLCGREPEAKHAFCHHGARCSCGVPLGQLHACPDNPARPLADPTETLALIAEYRLRLYPYDGGWVADTPASVYSAEGPTIGDAVRACVSRIRGQQ
jgi:hypothetical protein